MPYTVKKIARLSGVSIRTLHWYDKIGLLKPAFIGHNGYRYYEDEQLFILIYDILFFKDLGLSLNEIKKLISQPASEKVSAMIERKKSLIQDIQLKSSLLVSIDKTLHHFDTMSLFDSEFPHDFDAIRQREYEFFLITHKNYSTKDLSKIQQYRTQTLSKSELNHLKQASIRYYGFLTNMLVKNVSPNDEKVINSTQQHFMMLEKFYHIDMTSYCQMKKIFIKRPKILEMHNFYHKRLNHYFSNVICYFSELSDEPSCT